MERKGRGVAREGGRGGEKAEVQREPSVNAERQEESHTSGSIIVTGPLGTSFLSAQFTLTSRNRNMF